MYLYNPIQSQTYKDIEYKQIMGTNGQLFPLTDNTDGAAVDQVQQHHLFVSKLHFVHRLTLG
jgi:hypothetical protein